MSRQQFDTILNKLISRKLLVFAIACIGLFNQTLTSLFDKSENKDIKIGEMVELTSGKQLILSKEDGGRVAVISIANK